MSLISRDVDYALRALAYMKQCGEGLVSTAQLRVRLGLPRPFMRKVFQKLEAAGVVKSSKGNKGGFMTIMRPEEINLGLLVKVLQGGLGFGDCKFNKKPCPRMKGCRLHAKLDYIEKIVLDELAMVSVAGLLK